MACDVMVLVVQILRASTAQQLLCGHSTETLHPPSSHPLPGETTPPGWYHGRHTHSILLHPTNSFNV